MPAATHGYIYESIDPGETETIGAGASGHVILEYDGASGANDWCGVEVVNVQILED